MTASYLLNYKTEEQQQISTLYEKLLKSYRYPNLKEDIEVISAAYEKALEYHHGSYRKTGEPYVTHSLEVAIITASEMGLGKTSVVCALLHDVLKYTDTKPDAIKKDFGETAAQIITGLSKIAGVYTKNANLQADNFIKLLLNLSNDIRIILIKLADRMHAARTLDVISEEKQKIAAAETQKIYAPIAHRLGLYNIKTELEEISMKYLYPEVYHTIQEKMRSTENERREYISSFVNPINAELEEKGFERTIKGRSKSIPSIWAKMKKQKVDFEEVYDLFAIRIILENTVENEKADCWKVYSIITDKYTPNPKRLRDWITTPKSSGYESLHTTVIGPQGKWVEVQIRTRRMDEVAEKGHAAHWKYKGGKEKETKQSWLARMRDLLEKPDPKQIDTANSEKADLYSDKIFVFTPKADLKKLSANATVLDFAFAIHTNVGAKCTGAKINGRIVPLGSKLQNGDEVEIITNNSQTPSKDWLKIVQTPHAKAKVRKALNEKEFKFADDGKQILKKKFASEKIEFSEVNIRKIVRHFKAVNQAEVFNDISDGRIELNKILELFRVKEKKKPEKKTPLPILNKNIGKDDIIIDNHEVLKDYKIAKCCKPLRGDKVFGFVTVNNGITIHKESCPNAAQMKERYPYRVIQAHWNDFIPNQEYIINIEGVNKPGVLAVVTSEISADGHVDIAGADVKTEAGRYYIKVKVETTEKSKLFKAIERVKATGVVGQLTVK